MNVVKVRGNIPLNLAAERGNIDIAQLLLDRNAKIDAIGKYGRTALIIAVIHRREKVARFDRDAYMKVRDDEFDRMALLWDVRFGPYAW